MTPRVVHVATERGERGGERQLALLLEHRRHEAVLVAPAGADWPARIDAPCRRVGFVGRLWGARAVARIVDDVRPHVVAVHTHHALAHVAGGSVPVVVHRRLDFAPSRRSVARYATAAHVVAVSVAVEGVLRRSGVRVPITVIRDAVVPFGPGPWPAGPPHVVALGALVAHKGHLDLIEAMTEVPARLTIAGEGPLRRRLERLVARRGLGNRVALPGHVGDVEGLLHSAHVFVHPSREEGLGQAVVEAFTAGRPVVATHAGGVPEVVRDRGRLVPTANPTALAAALRSVLHDLDRARAEVLSVRAEVVRN
ncbi:MAG: glycosyltransferase, partial [Myxococcota bacterium]